MSNPKKSDHWLDLAQEIGVEGDEKLVQREESDDLQEASAEPVSEEVAEQLDPASENESQADVETPEELASEDPVVATQDASPPATDDVEEDAQAESAPQPPVAADSWFNLASSLGIDVPPPEPPKAVKAEEPKAVETKPRQAKPRQATPRQATPKQEVRPQQAAKPTREPKTAVTDEAPVAPRGFFKTVSNAISKAMSKTEELVEGTVDENRDESPAVDSVESQASQVEDTAADRPEVPASDGPLSLFEDPDLRLDTPGVLDAVFDDDEAVIASALRSPRSSRRRRPAPSPVETDEKVADEKEAAESTSASARRVTDFAAELNVKEAEKVETSGAVETKEASEADKPDVSSDTEEPGETSELEPSDDQKRGRRRKRRRRRRPARRERDETADSGAADSETADSSEADPIVAESGADETAEESADRSEAAQDKTAPREDRSRSRRRRRVEPAAGETDDADEDGDADAGGEDADEELVEKAKHKKIPTWEEAITVLVSANLEARAKNPGGGGPRGRGRRGRR